MTWLGATWYDGEGAVGDVAEPGVVAVATTGTGGKWMNEVVGIHAETQETDCDLPNVTGMPIMDLLRPAPTVLDNLLRRVIRELAKEREASSGFGNIPEPLSGCE